MPNPTRIVVPTDCHNTSTWETALEYALAIYSKFQPEATEIILLTHTDSQLDHASLYNHIGQTKAKKLLANKSISVLEDVQLRHATLKTLSKTAVGAVIIAYYAEDEMMDTIDGLLGVIGVVAVPEYADAIDKWCARWTPKVHGQQQGVAVKLLTDAVVEKALSTVISTRSLSHVSDKNRADETLRILRAKGHDLDVDNIKSYAIKKGWDPRAADQLAKLADKIKKLKSKPSISKFPDADRKYQHWNE
jgi:hypothetical protein